MNRKDNREEIKRLRKKIDYTKGLFALSILCILIIFISTSLSELLEDGVEVQPRSELTYYLNVSYDGIDKNGKKSDSTTVSEIRSGDLFIEDKLPEGLVFDGFVTTSNGSFGAVQRSDKKTLCTGKVVDDTNDTSITEGTWNADKTEYTYHGLHYDTSTRTVTFRVRNLQAGCELVVGIKTKTPTIDDPLTSEIETRRDFYNFATAREKDLTVKSNTVHAFMGKMINTLHEISYVYEGDIPPNAPSPPDTMKYIAGATVGVAADINIEGYEFSGWKTTDVSISNNKFIMPDKNVILKGKFTKINKNKVTYKITGKAPDGYVTPTEKEYVKGSSIDLDILKEGDIINGYRFLGWNTTDVEIDRDNKFVMPEKDVVITGQFEEIRYKVFYQFYDTILPPDWNKYIPEVKSYKPGETVKLEEVNVESTSNYDFLGWYSEDNFIMPEKDVTIYGEWKHKPLTTSPRISTEIVGNKDYYRIGDIVKLKINVTNTATYNISNVLVEEKTNNIEFINNESYEIKSSHFVNIKSIESGKTSSIYLNYKITASDKKNIKTLAEIKGISAIDEGITYELKKDEDYTSTATIKLQSQLKLCNTVNGVGPNNTFQVHVTGIENGYETWVSFDKNSCEIIHLNPGKYNIKEIVPQEYNLIKVEKSLNKNNSNLTVEEDNTYEVLFTNEFKKEGFLHSFGRSTFKILQRRDEK